MTIWAGACGWGCAGRLKRLLWVGSGHCRSSLGRSHGEGDRSLKASGGGAAAVAPKPLRQPCGLPPPHGFATGRINGSFRSKPLAPTPATPKKNRPASQRGRSEEHTSELQSLMRISYAVFCLKKTKRSKHTHHLNNSDTV